MYAFIGDRRQLIWFLLAVLVAVAVAVGALHGMRVVSSKVAAIMIFSWSLTSFGLIAATMFRSARDYIPPIANPPFPGMKRAFLFKAGSAVFVTLLFGFMPQERWPFSAFGQFMCSAAGIIVLPDLIALLRFQRRSRRDH